MDTAPDAEPVQLLAGPGELQELPRHDHQREAGLDEPPVDERQEPLAGAERHGGTELQAPPGERVRQAGGRAFVKVGVGEEQVQGTPPSGRMISYGRAGAKAPPEAPPSCGSLDAISPRALQ